MMELFSNNETTALLRLVLAGGAIAPRRELLRCYLQPSAALIAGEEVWKDIGLTENQILFLRKGEKAIPRACWKWLDQPHTHLIGWHQSEYPPLLRKISSAPLALFVEGNPNGLWRAGIALVGSRSATGAGREIAREFTNTFAKAGFSIVSGLAAGIDAAAHLAALNHSQAMTVAVLGTGTDMVYPPQHAKLHQQIIENGVIVSEFPPQTPPRTQHFPSRNRIIAGLSLAVVVIEAAERSGALITARQAADYGREVFAVPGSIYNPQARGCHRLIRDGAGLVESAQEVISAIEPLAQQLASSLQQQLYILDTPQTSTSSESLTISVEIEKDAQPVWDALEHSPLAIDTLVERTGLSTAELTSQLLLLELDGHVLTEHGRYWRKY